MRPVLERSDIDNIALSEPTISAATSEQPRWDYIIIGAGSAGLPAAIFASRRGARVLLIEAAAEVGGTLPMAFGQVSAARTRLQQTMGVEDSPDWHFDDVMRMTRGFAEPELVRLAVEEAPATLNWLLDAGLVPLPDHPITADAPGRPGYSVPRYLWGKDYGRSIFDVVMREFVPEVESQRIQLRLNTRATSLLVQDSHTVVGVRTISSDGLEEEHHGRHTILTTGGYSMNPAAFERLIGTAPYTSGAHPFAKGDGLALATGVGGILRGRALHRAGPGSILSGTKFPAKLDARFITSPQSRPPYEIWVNAQGKRFIREDEPDGYDRDAAVALQSDFRYAVIFDDEIFRTAPPGVLNWTREQMEAQFNVHPMFARARALSDLANAAQIDPVGLKATVEAYNAGVAARSDIFGREHAPLPIAKPPFYAITLLGHSSTSAVGVTVDSQLRVTDHAGEPIQGLYAAGEVLGSGVFLGGAFVGGMLLTPAMSLGRRLGLTLPIQNADKNPSPPA